VKWPEPSGLVERFTNLPIDRYITITEGSGKWH
jgi:enediyne biosynthesis protein E4